MMSSSKELAASAEEHEDMKEIGLQHLRDLELKVDARLAQMKKSKKRAVSKPNFPADLASASESPQRLKE